MTAPTTRKSAISSDIFGTTLTLTFSNGKELAIDVNALTPEIVQQATLHGLKQKLVDAAAITCDKTTGKSATIDDKFNAVQKVWDRLMGNGCAPAWNAPREGVERGAGGVFLRAMMRITGKDRATMQAELEALGKEKVAALKKNSRVVDMIHTIEKEDLKDGADDSDDLLNELTGA